MCLLIVSFHEDRDYPLVFAANRDERYERPASPLGLRAGDLRVLAGRDDLAGGTWLAVNEAGVVAGLTNQPTLAEPDRRRRSRGELPLRLVEHNEARAAVQEMRLHLDTSEYNPCSLLIGDREALFSMELTPGQPLIIRELAPGHYVLENCPFCVATAKHDFNYASTSFFGDDLDVSGLRAKLAEVLADHSVHDPLAGERERRPGRPPEYSSACVHTPNYGTRSSLIVTVPSSAAVLPEVFAAEGAPCVTPFEDQSVLWG